MPALSLQFLLGRILRASLTVETCVTLLCGVVYVQCRVPDEDISGKVQQFLRETWQLTCVRRKVNCCDFRLAHRVIKTGKLAICDQTQFAVIDYVGCSSHHSHGSARVF